MISLEYTWKTTTQGDQMKNRKQLIKIEKDGPYLLEDGSALTTSQGASIEIMPRVHLCRCGNSGDKPFCDGTAHAEHPFYGGCGEAPYGADGNAYAAAVPG
jgi:CDGSH-type Zn-finger protein